MHISERRSFLFSLLLLAFIPVFISLIRPDWLFTNPYQLPWFDPFVYIGYYMNYPAYVTASPDYYPGERLSVIVPGYLFYSLVGPVKGSAVLRFFLWMLGVFSFYALIRKCFGQRTALFTSVLLGFHATFLTAASWDYIDGFANSYHLLALALLAWATDPKYRRLCLFLSGCALALLLLTSSFMTLFFPGLVVFAFYMLKPQSFAESLSYLRILLIGFLLTIVVLSCVNALAGGPFFLFGSQIKAIFHIFSGKEASADPSAWQDMLYRAPWAALPLVLGILAFYHIVTSSSVRQTLKTLFRKSAEASALTKRDLFAGLMVYQLIVFLGLQFTKYPVLSFFFYSSLLVPLAFLYLASLFENPLKSLSTRGFYLLTVGILGACLILLIPDVGAKILSIFKLTYYATFTWIPALIFFIAMLFFVTKGQRAWKFICGIAFFCVANVLALNTPQLNYFNYPDRAPGARALTQSVKYFQNNNRDGQLGIWINTAEQPFGSSQFWAAWIADHVRMGIFRSTELPKFDPATLSSNTSVAAFSKSPTVEDQILPALEEKGFQGAVEDKLHIHEGTEDFWITLVRIIKPTN